MVHLIERAFELARSGDYSGISAIEKRLKTEGFLDVKIQLEAPTLRKQLSQLCRESRRGV